MTEVLSPIDAAYRFDVTPELLFANVSDPPKRHSGTIERFHFKTMKVPADFFPQI